MSQDVVPAAGHHSSATATEAFVFRAPSGTGWRRVGRAPVDVPVGTPRFLHVVQQGAVLRQCGTRIVVTVKDQVILDVATFRLEGVLIYGAIQITTQCLRMLMKENVWVAFFSRNGVYWRFRPS